MMTTEKKDPRIKVKNGVSMPLIFILMLTIFLVLMVFYFHSLANKIDVEISRKLKEAVWDMPAKVYGRSFSFNEKEIVNRNYIIRVLKSARYHETENVNAPGEYQLISEGLILFRREFLDIDQHYPETLFIIKFRDGKILSINNKVTLKSIKTLFIEPRLVTLMYSPSGEQRIFMPLDKYPKSLINILISTEDKRFYQHNGIDLFAIARAFISNLKSGKTTEGGSTLTQQVVKNMFLSREKTYTRKIREVIMALIIERKMSKEKILELYLNEIYLGQDGSYGIYGIPLASTYYFGREVNELSISQQALLIGMAKGASLYNPWNRPDIAVERRNLVLQLAYKHNAISGQQFRAAMHNALCVQPKRTVFTQHPSFLNILKKEIRNTYNIELNELSGASILSTLDPLSQEDTETTIKNIIPILDKKTELHDLQSAIVVVNNKTGNLLAVVGDKDVYFNGFNRAADAKRQIGSLVKPFVYLAALKHPDMFRLNTWIEDLPINIDIGSGDTWSPRNHTRSYSGKVMLINALAYSINVATVNLGMAVGTEEVASVLRSVGIPEDKIALNPSMLLGTLDMSPVELAEGFQTLSNKGQHTGINSMLAIISREGAVIYRKPTVLRQVVPEQAAWLTLHAMQKSVHAGTSKGLGNRLKKYSLAGKTGTSSNNRDSWFVGIDGEKVVLSWVGRDNNQPTKLWGANGALLLTKEFFIINGVKALKQDIPQDIHHLFLDDTGNIKCQNKEVINDKEIKFKKLPVWTDNIISTCQEGAQFTPVSINKKYSTESLDSLF